MKPDDFSIMTGLPFITNNELRNVEGKSQNPYCIKRCKNRDCIYFLNNQLIEDNQQYRCNNNYDCVGFIDGKGNKYLINGIILESNEAISLETKRAKSDFVYSDKEVRERLRRSIYFSSCNDSLEREDIEKNYSILHDIRAAMGIVSKFLDNLVQEQEGRSFKEKLDGSSPNLKNLYDAIDLTRDQMQMIDVIVNPGSITNGSYKRTNLYKLFERVGKLMQARAAERNVDINWYATDRIEDAYYYDSIQFIPLILLDNAIKYSHRGKSVRVYINLINSHTVQLKVSSFGKTVDYDEVDRIFKKFVQGSNSRQYSSGGIGLGLWVLSNIVQAHNGTVKYERDDSEYGANNFIVDIPYLTQNPVVVKASRIKPRRNQLR